MEIIREFSGLAPYYGASFVPTMGALHGGHRALIAAARVSGLPVIVSIFVNPSQFGPGEDFERYPRPTEEDLDICREEKVTAVFLPSNETIYPPGFAVRVAVPSLSNLLCGAHRPGHFDGVATVVARLFGLIRPARAFFGWKDAQQLVIIRRMVSDMAMGIEIVGVPTVRESNGLALSSRNQYLAPDERRRAACIHEALRIGMEAAVAGESVAASVRGAVDHLRSAALIPEYLECRRLDDLGELPADRPLDHSQESMEYLFATAVRIGGTRLIDNLRLAASGGIR